MVTMWTKTMMNLMKMHISTIIIIIMAMEDNMSIDKGTIMEIITAMDTAVEMDTRNHTEIMILVINIIIFNLMYGPFMKKSMK